MRQVLLRRGSAFVEDVPAPMVDSKSIRVATSFSCVSIGTESSSLSATGEQLYRRVLRQPAKIRRAVDMVKDQGIVSTFRHITGALATPHVTGYSAAGTVVEIGSDVVGFRIGDRVACAGAGIANHAEILSVPVNLAVHVPLNVDLMHASTVTLGAIALQAVRRTAPTLGEVILVIGLGTLGQLVTQLLRANGCRTIGVDPDPGRLAIALECGLSAGIDPRSQDIAAGVMAVTDGLGADAAIVTASSQGSEPVQKAMQACRRKGRVVLVGDVGLSLRREDMYRKELDLQMSTSYGPGRYDPMYEDQGQDYPLPYVRWTENRNMGAYLDLLASGHVKLSPMKPRVVDLPEATQLYAALRDDTAKPLLAFIRYAAEDSAVLKTQIRIPRTQRAVTGRHRVAVIGAGAFARAVHLPNLAKMREQFDLRWIVSRTGSVAKAVAQQYGASYADTDFEAILGEKDVDVVLICTRHHLHAGMALAALKAGKHVYLEKPMALNEVDLASLESFLLEEPGDKPVLWTGFNRRFSPAAQFISARLKTLGSTRMISYRMNAGYLAPEHWVHGKEGGGRNIGEACHIYDLFTYLIGSSPRSCTALAAQRLPGGGRANENFVATLDYDDGSVASLLYTALGTSAYAKERMDVFAGHTVISLDDYRTVTVTGNRDDGWSNRTPEKGHFESLNAFAQAICTGDVSANSLETQIEATRTSFAIEKLLRNA